MLHTNQKEKQERICSNPKCNELGVYPAPKSRDQLREYLYFCINCIRDFNKSWNYFEGLNEQELEVEIRKSVTWDRPSWKFGTKNINYDFEGAFNRFENKKNIRNKKVLNEKLENAFRILDLSFSINFQTHLFTCSLGEYLGVFFFSFFENFHFWALGTSFCSKMRL
mgnify:CR=1 FL=1